MASINGISIKSLKNFRDHEGFTIHQGNVYYRNRKLGFWSQDSWGGGDLFEFDHHILDGEVEKYRKSDLVIDEYRDIVDLEIMLGDIVHLIEDEKLYKKGAKDGFVTMVLADNSYRMEAYATTLDKQRVLKSKDYKEFVKDHDGWKVTIFGSVDDFNIEV